MKQTLYIGCTLPGLNDYTRDNRANRYGGAQTKKVAEAIVTAYIRASGISPMRGPVRMRYTWREPNRRRDKDNIAFARKFIQDALVAEGILSGDGWKDIDGFEDAFEVNAREPGVVVEMEEV